MQSFRETLKDYAKDIKLNLGSVLSPEGAPGLTPAQLWGIALASAYATKTPSVVDAVLEGGRADLSDQVVEAAKGAATLMAMNNVYYRTMHLSEDKEIGKLPAKLRMNLLGKPGIPKADFELMSLAVSAIAGCGSCINAHVHEARKGGLSSEGIQSVIRIASVINAAAQAVAIN